MAKSKNIFIGMNIKQIIKEEINDFDWAKDVPSAPQLVTPENAKKGMRVKVSDDINNYDERDFDRRENKMGIYLRQSSNGEGIITNPDYSSLGSGHGWARVRWDNGAMYPYPIGFEGNYSLVIVD